MEYTGSFKLGLKGSNDEKVCKIGTGRSCACRRLLHLEDKKAGFGIAVLGVTEGAGQFGEGCFRQSRRG